MDGPPHPSSDPPVRRERKKWEKESSFSLYINEAELSKWTSKHGSKSSEPLSPSSTLKSQSSDHDLGSKWKNNIINGVSNGILNTSNNTSTNTNGSEITNKWVSRNNPPLSPHTLRSQQNTTATTTNKVQQQNTTTAATTSTLTHSAPSPKLQRSLSKSSLNSTLTKSPSSPSKPSTTATNTTTINNNTTTTTRARPPSPASSVLASRNAAQQQLQQSPSSPSQSLSKQRGATTGERFKSPRRAMPPSRAEIEKTAPSSSSSSSSPASKPAKPSLSSPTTSKPSPPPSTAPTKSSQPTTPPNNTTKAAPSASIAQQPSSPPQPGSSISPPTGGKAVDPSDKTRIVNFMCGVLKIFAHLAGLPEGAEKQKEVKLGALEKRCKERLPPGLCMSVLDVLNDFRFLNALYDIPDQLEDIKATTTEFEKKISQFMSIISSKFGGMDLMKEQANALSNNASKKIQICSCKVALRAALQSGNDVIITETLNKCREVGMDADTVDLAQNLAKCLRVDAGVAVADVPKFTTLLERAVSLRMLDEDFSKAQTLRLAQLEELLRSIESSAIVAGQDGNLAPFREILDKAKEQGANSDDLTPYRAAYQDLNARVNVVREIVESTKAKHQTKLLQALDKARSMPSLESDTMRAESAAIRQIREGDTGVHKMLSDAIQSGTSVLTHLESVAAVRALLETSVSAEDKPGLEEVITRGSALGMTREVEAARNALRAMDRIRIKCHLHTDIRILSVPRDTRFPDLKSKIEQTYGATAPFIMKYRDDVGDLITLASHDDLTTALQTMDASVETKDGTKRTTGPKLDVFLSVPSQNVRASVEVKEKRSSSSKLHPNTQLAASVQQLYDFLSSERRATTPQVPPSTSSPLYSPPQPNSVYASSPNPPTIYSSPPSHTSVYSTPSFVSDTSPPVPRARPATSYTGDFPPHLSHHYDHLIDPEKDTKPHNSLSPVPPPKTAKSSKGKRSKRDSKEKPLFVAGKSFAP